MMESHTLDKPHVAPATDVLVDSGTGELGMQIVAALHGTKASVVDVGALVRERTQTPLGAAVVLVGRATACRQPSESTIELIRAGQPHVSVWVCARPHEGVGADVVRYANAGAGWVFEIEKQAPSELRALLQVLKERVRAPAPSGLVWSVAREVGDPEARMLAIDCLLESFRRRRVSDVERRFGCDHKTLNDMLERANLLTVGRLQRAGRLAHDRELSRRGGLTREEIARALGFGSAKRLAEAWRTAERSGLVQDGEIVVFRP